VGTCIIRSDTSRVLRYQKDDDAGTRAKSGVTLSSLTLHKRGLESAGNVPRCGVLVFSVIFALLQPLSSFTRTPKYILWAFTLFCMYAQHISLCFDYEYIVLLDCSLLLGKLVSVDSVASYQVRFAIFLSAQKPKTKRLNALKTSQVP
jgi:hypothetical protein